MEKKKSTYCPCKGCEDRHVGCHASCGKYAEYRVQFDEAAKDKERQRDAKNFRHDGVTKSVKRYRGQKKR